MVWNYVSEVNPCLSHHDITSTFSCKYPHQPSTLPSNTTNQSDPGDAGGDEYKISW